VLMRTITGSVVLIALNVTIYGFIQFLPTFMVKQGMSIVTSLNYTTLMSLGGPVGALIGFFLSDRLGRRNLLIGFSVVAIGFGLAYPQASDPVLVTLLGFGLVTSVYVLVAVGWSLYVPELFPTEIRMRGNGFCNMAGRAMAIVMPQFIVPLFGTGGLTGVMALVIGLLLAMAILVAMTGYEARRTSLEAVTPWGEDERRHEVAEAQAPL
jgi:MFS transporter, putative metabolite:H+ symporter